MNAGPALVGIDLGTTVCRSLVFSRTLEILGSASHPLPLTTRSGSEIEQNAECWWETAVRVVRESLQAAQLRGGQLKAISVSSQGLSFVPVDSACLPMRSALSWMDTRAVRQRRRVAETLGEEKVFSITGKRCHETYVLPKLLWLREHERDRVDSCHRILMPLDFLLARLTGEYVTDHSMASGTMYYDVTRRAWSTEILDAFSLDRGKLPEIRQGGAPVGRLREEAAEALGLSRDVVVTVGGQDQKVAALGAGIDPEKTTISLGTAMAITQKLQAPVIDRLMRVPCFADLLPGFWVLEGSSVCCSILDWVHQSFFPGTSHEDLNRMAAEAEHRENPPVLLPFFSGALSPYYDPSSKGTLHGLDLSTTPGQIVRSVYEGIAFLVRANIAVMEGLSRPVDALRVFGGGSRSDEWCQIIADVTGRPVVTLKTFECASVGAAMLAGLGSGVFQDIAEPFSHVRTRGWFQPRPDRRDRYEAMYARFEELRLKLIGGASGAGGL